MTLSPASSALFNNFSTASGDAFSKPISAPPKPSTVTSMSVFPRRRFSIVGLILSHFEISDSHRLPLQQLRLAGAARDAANLFRFQCRHDFGHVACGNDCHHANPHVEDLIHLPLWIDPFHARRGSRLDQSAGSPSSSCSFLS